METRVRLIKACEMSVSNLQMPSKSGGKLGFMVLMNNTTCNHINSRVDHKPVWYEIRNVTCVGTNVYTIVYTNSCEDKLSFEGLLSLRIMPSHLKSEFYKTPLTFEYVSVSRAFAC